MCRAPMKLRLGSDLSNEPKAPRSAGSSSSPIIRKRHESELMLAIEGDTLLRRLSGPPKRVHKNVVKVSDFEGVEGRIVCKIKALGPKANFCLASEMASKCIVAN